MIAETFHGWRRVTPYVLLTAAPVLTRLYFMFLYSGDDWSAASNVWVARVLACAALGFVLLCARELFALRAKAPGAPATNQIGPGALGCILLPMTLYVGVYSWQAYVGLYLGDQDFTNISTAINNSARGSGVLATPYIDTGPYDTFLAHHFAPALLLFVPVYWLAGLIPASWFVVTHFVYALALGGVFVAGLWLWLGIVRREVAATFAPALVAILALALPLWRLVGSFHFEVLVLPASALVFGARRAWVFWVGVFLFLGIKEDMAVYLFCYGLWLTFASDSARGAGSPAGRRRGPWLLLVCVLYFLFALMAMKLLGHGDSVIDGATDGVLPWGAYWRDIWNTDLSFAPAVLVIAALGCVPLLAGRVFLIVLAPVLFLHLTSYHPWHQSFTGHYIYTILPALLLSFVRGFARLPELVAGPGRWIGSASTGSQNTRGRLVLYALMGLVCARAALDQATPVGWREAPARRGLEQIIQKIPAEACVQAAIPASPHVPLTHPAYPLLPPAGHRLRDESPPYIDRRDLAQGCSEWTLLFAPDDPRPPYYIEEHLHNFTGLGTRLDSIDGWTLRRLP